MSTSVPAKLQEVKRVSRLLQRFFKFLFAVSVVGFVAATLFALLGESSQEQIVELVGIWFTGDEISGKIMLLGIVGAALRILVSLKALYHLIRLFGSYAGGQIFTADNVNQIRQLGVTMMLLAAIWLLDFTVALPEITEKSDQWGRIVQSFPTLELVGGAIVILVSWVMDAGRELREEHDLVV